MVENKLLQKWFQITFPLVVPSKFGDGFLSEIAVCGKYPSLTKKRKLNRERNLYGSDFEVKLRNKLEQKAIAKECADWIRRKVKFKSNASQEGMGGFLHVQNQKPSAYVQVSRPRC